jgi:hypothetical protein
MKSAQAKGGNKAVGAISPPVQVSPKIPHLLVRIFMKAVSEKDSHIIGENGRRQDGKGIFQLSQSKNHFVTIRRIAFGAGNAHSDRM